ncbi:acyl-CoA dehydrogenase [Tistrella bauzanensis]|uniref:Acyl-CoA dehydrogenase n=1 Tax=Tistrella bauzanensis TaxID=657419 RepID=A0ABQ1J6F6_9PROT|nr:acyl-CoA dehydrogenase C-terminal domain-containing protein [Tistrella bauzanensis]GGB59910.1 acyl-CoA dehydrogenase [Tistrella bauzanensis]
MAATYKAPLRDIRFVLHDVLDVSRIAELPGYEDATPDIFDAVLEEAAKMCENELFPINRSGDEEGCTFENGVVRTPAGFKEAYKTFIEAGWTSIAADPKYGGQGLPKTLNFVIEEMICSANLAFGMYPGLSAGAYNAIAAHATDELKQRYLPKLGDGSWSGTMCLTEPHCGTDLGLIRTRAVPADDGTFRVTGTKIFISAGEHDLTENIIHLVLAKLPGAPEGTRGISLFLVPKFIPDDQNASGARNGVACGSIEHKMGIKASATCVLNFDDAVGWMVGEPHRGLQAMFTMMNVARLAVGMQGLGIGEAAYQGAVDYARDRTSGRALTGAKYPDQSADPIIVHPDVRRNLLTMRALNEGARALSYWIGTEIDIAHHHPDPATRQAADDLVQLMTPIIKAFLTDIGFDNANRGVQIYGGHGYIREHGMEQYVRDARITQLYEGTNGIQALDLVGRKLPTGMGRLLRRFFHPVDAYIAGKKGDAALKDFTGPLAKAFQRLQQATAGLAQKAMANPDEAGAAATPYLRMFALVALAYMWTRMAEVATAKIAVGEDVAFHTAKLKTGRYFMEQVLPEHLSAFAVAMAGARTVMALDDDEF